MPVQLLPILGALGSAALGIGANAGAHAIGNAQQIKQQERIQALQLKGNKEMLDYQKMKDLEMWEKTNYHAQVEQLRKAGLNPGLLYGMGGAGGATVGSSGAGVSGGTATNGMAMQLNVMREIAEIENLKADTKKKNVEATKTEGVDTREAETRILDLTQGVENKKAQEKLLKIQFELANLDTQIKGATLEEASDIIRYQSYKLQNEVNLISNDLFISNATKDEKIKMVQAELIGALLKNDEIGSNIAVNVAQIQKWLTENAQGWAKLGLEERNTKVQELLSQFNTSVEGAALHSIGGIISTIISRGFSKAPVIQKGPTTINNN